MQERGKETTGHIRRCGVGVFLLVLLLSVGAGYGQLSEANEEDKPVYVFKGDHAYPPFEYLKDGIPTGFNVDLLNAVARVMQMDIRIELGPWDEVRREFEAGEIDGLTGFFQHETRSDLADFSVPFLQSSVTFFKQKNSPDQSLKAVWNKSVIVQTGDIAHDYLLGEKYPGKIIEESSAAAALRRLARGEGDGALMEHTQAMYLCKELGLHNIVSTEENIAPALYCFAVARQNVRLLDQLNEGYRLVLVTGEFGQIWLNWFKETLEEEGGFYFPISYFLIAVLIIVSVLSWLALWSYLLRREVARRTRDLRESEERYRTLFENSSDSMFLIRDRVLDCNQQACKMLKMPREELIGITPSEFSAPVQPDGRNSEEAANAYIAEALSGHPQIFTWVHRRSDGELLDVEVSLCRITGLSEPACLAAVRDLSTRIKAEQVMRSQQDLLRTIMETSPVGICTFSPGGVINFANAQMERIFHMKRSELCGRAHDDVRWDMLDIDGNPFLKGETPFLYIVNQKKPVYDLQYSVARTGGGRVVLSVNATPLLGEDGIMTGIVATMEDITARVEIEREREARWQRIEQQQAAIIRIGRDAAAVEWDFTVLAQMIVSLSAEVLDVSFSSLWLLNEDASLLACIASSAIEPASETKVLRVDEIPAYMEALESGRHVDAPDARHDPRTMHLLENYLVPNKVGALLDAPVRVGGKLVGVLCNEHHGGPRYWRPDELQFAAEISDQVSQALVLQERRRTEEERRMYEKRMQQSQKLESLGILAGGLAHDFNNLLTAIMGNVDLSLMDIPEENPATSSLKEIKALSNRAADLCRSMLAYAGKGTFVIKPLGLNEEVRQMGQMTASSITRNIHVVYALDDNLPAVDADKGQIHQVIMNLLLNAAEAIGDKNGTITVRTEKVECDPDYFQDGYFTDMLEDGTYVALEVSDTGAGMDRETLEKIFNPFFSTKFVGRGMGLSGVLGIVRGHKGSIRVYSEPGHGSIFTVLLPASTGTYESDHGFLESASTQGEYTTVLLVDANLSSQRITTKILGRLGYAVVTAAGLEEAADLLRNGRHSIPCMIIEHAPNFPFDEQKIRELRREFGRTALLMTTDLEERDAARLYGRLGFVSFLQKPYRVAELAAKISTCIGG
ncbi:MAG: transporter substrate-binding domain-containing protein [Candidatus Hydrogenedentes bacterium]|nr:transporter substrate-binding domain-containing protein [Candidatus Hydrogenedentota bacterium]